MYDSPQPHPHPLPPHTCLLHLSPFRAYLFTHAPLPGRGKVTQQEECGFWSQCDICLNESLNNYVALGRNWSSTSGCPFKMQIKPPHCRVIGMTEEAECAKHLTQHGTAVTISILAGLVRRRRESSPCSFRVNRKILFENTLQQKKII